MRILVTTAHPDDHVIMAGTLLKLKEEFNAEIREITFSFAAGGTAEVETRKREIENAANFLGIEHKFLVPRNREGKEFNTPERLTEYKDEYKLGLIYEIRDFKPDILFTLPPYDYHIAHRLTALITFDAVRMAMTGAYSKLGKKHRVKIVAYPDSINMVKDPSLYFDITKYFDKKIYLWREIYKSQYDPSIEDLMRGLALVRAKQTNNKNVKYAEAFELWSDQKVLFDDIVELLRPF